ncbi:MAG: hypothetical protein KC417_07825 [Myxococcales bacterium]|nr:hypothetical protein [Myxococcales bacterium]
MRADQFLVTDEEYTHTAKEMSHHSGPPTEVLPSNWASPVDYRQGTMHVRVELKSTASSKGIRWLVVFGQPGVYTCGTQKSMNGPGIYEWDTPVSKYSCKGDGYDFGAPPKSITYVIRDASGVKVDSGQPYAGAPDLSLYYPLEARVTVTMVSNGATYVPPAPEMDASVPDAGAPDAMAAPDAAAVDDAGQDAGVWGAPDAEILPDASMPSAPGPEADLGTPSGAAHGTIVHGQGCSLSSRPTKGDHSAWWLVGGAAFALWRRRAR